MLTTNNQSLNFSITDSTVYVAPGAIQLGSYVIPFRGDSITYSEMTTFTASNVFQYSILALKPYNFQPYLTIYDSTSFDSTQLPVYPSIGSDSSVYPIGLFLFHTDGTTIDLVSSSRIS